MEKDKGDQDEAHYAPQFKKVLLDLQKQPPHFYPSEQLQYLAE